MCLSGKNQRRALLNYSKSGLKMHENSSGEHHHVVLVISYLRNPTQTLNSENAENRRTEVGTSRSRKLHRLNSLHFTETGSGIVN